MTDPTPRERRRPLTEFETFAMDHKRHAHCQGCAGCLLNPSYAIQGFPAWCIGCRDRIKAQCAKVGAPLPWFGGWEFI